jgi:tRNA(Ile2) C34 agmatinyltransferase TiaS
MSPRALSRLYKAGARFMKSGGENGFRCESCGRPIAESDREWHPDDDSPFLEDMLPPRWCSECARVGKGR